MSENTPRYIFLRDDAGPTEIAGMRGRIRYEGPDVGEEDRTKFFESFMTLAEKAIRSGRVTNGYSLRADTK
jgi:hypothetical protein